ncbi:MAG TPA: phosphatidate cytidylyltransferase [Bacilli bacterium]|jgi:phosphatidate cytidylyltransferase|nr:phosphatidate cytidylyltransferase [Bacilli bacterium]HPZ23725.1 phosphatidate cytidylyltransferase [Bacilli bacterium]HQC83762.1 phosphatidate cytidylyltransferase [Bacilli bacterium]
MKKRILGAIIILAVCIPSFIIGGYVALVLIGILSLLSYKELLDVKDDYKINNYMKIVGLISTLILSYSSLNGSIILGLSYCSLGIVLILELLPTIFLKDYRFTDAIYLVFITMLSGIVGNMFNMVFIYNKYIFLWLVIIACMTDVFAYLGGMLFGKHKLTKISPKKTIEGSIIGTLFGATIGSLYYILMFHPHDIILFVIMSILLSIIGQFGDLFFSLIKRENNVKDYSKIIPGHGGILDRVDSLVFIVIVFAIIVNIL